MRWRPVAAAAAGVVAVVGLGSHRAAADTGDEAADPAQSTTTTSPVDRALEQRAARLQEAAAAHELAQSLPKSPPSPEPTEVLPGVSASLGTGGAIAPGFSIGDQTPRFPRLSGEFTSLGGTKSPARPKAPHGNAAAARAAMAGQNQAADSNSTGDGRDRSPSGAPTDDASRNSTGPNQAAPVYATTTGSATNSTTASLPPTSGMAGAGDQWWPTWATDLVDRRFQAAWRANPSRGPPPGTASALGNDGRTTIYQVSIVKGKDGTQFSIVAKQSAVVNNVGVATAAAVGSGSASATGDQARTSIYQTTVVVQRGTGTANVEQSAHVDNVGVANAASAGSGTANAVGNASSTTVNQTAVVLLLGSGDAQVSQSADVTNAGGATAVATDTDSSAVGSNATTDVSQTAVLVVHDDDVTVNQRSSTTNVGLGDATGGTATGNSTTNTTSQVTVAH